MVYCPTFRPDSRSALGLDLNVVLEYGFYGSLTYVKTKWLLQELQGGSAKLEDSSPFFENADLEIEWRIRSLRPRYVPPYVVTYCYFTWIKSRHFSYAFFEGVTFGHKRVDWITKSTTIRVTHCFTLFDFK